MATDWDQYWQDRFKRRHPGPPQYFWTEDDLDWLFEEGIASEGFRDYEEVKVEPPDAV